MKVKNRFVLLMLMLLLFPPQAKATEEITTEVYFYRAGMKILTGVANVATGWIELPKNIILWSDKEESGLVGVSEGVLRGIVHTASRTGSGALDIATFLLPTFPTPTPSLVWDDFSQESEYRGFRMGR